MWLQPVRCRTRSAEATRPSLADGVTVVQDVMYKAIGLECGHKFCADCAFTCGTPASDPALALHSGVMDACSSRAAPFSR
jgi:hypothetical protein